MAPLNTLTKEHRMFERLIERLERSLALEETLARSEIRDTLLVLLPALERHEELEHLLFTGPTAGPAAGEVELQYQALRLLKQEVLETLQGYQESPFEKLKELVGQFAAKLRSQFVTEETKLWPEYRGTPARDRSARLQLGMMEREMQENWAQITDYLGARK